MKTCKIRYSLARDQWIWQYGCHFGKPWNKRSKKPKKVCPCCKAKVTLKGDRHAN